MPGASGIIYVSPPNEISYILKLFREEKSKMNSILVIVWVIAISTFSATSQTMSASIQNPTDSGGPSNEDPDWKEGWTNIIPPNHTGQSFIVKSQTLSSIEVALLTTGNKVIGKDTITMKVLSKDGTVLIKRSRRLDVGFNGWLRFEAHRQGLKVMPGEKLIIQLEDTGKVVFGWKYSLDKYPDGTAIMLGKEDKKYDFLFRVNP
jgi:hypothetical protein